MSTIMYREWRHVTQATLYLYIDGMMPTFTAFSRASATAAMANIRSLIFDPVWLTII